MKIVFTKNNPSTHTVSVFKDGKKFDEVMLDTKTYFLHDLSHYCVETELRFTEGFWGMIAQGYKMEQLAGKTNELTSELRQIERLVGATQSVYSGYMPLELFYENIKAVNYSVSADVLENVIKEIQAFMNEWNYLAVGQRLELEF